MQSVVIESKGEFIIFHGFEVPEDVFNCFPVGLSWVLLILGEYCNGE